MQGASAVHISGYVLMDATQQTDQRTSQMVYLFFAEALKFIDAIYSIEDGSITSLLKL